MRCFLIDTPVVVLWLVVLKEVQQKQHQYKEEREEETKKAMREAAILAEAPEVPVVPVRYQTSPTWCSIYLEPFMPQLGGEKQARQLYLYGTFHTRGRLSQVLHIKTLSYNKTKWRNGEIIEIKRGGSTTRNPT